MCEGAKVLAVIVSEDCGRGGKKEDCTRAECWIVKTCLLESGCLVFDITWEPALFKRGSDSPPSTPRPKNKTLPPKRPPTPNPTPKNPISIRLAPEPPNRFRARMRPVHRSALNRTKRIQEAPQARQSWSQLLQGAYWAVHTSVAECWWVVLLTGLKNGQFHCWL